MIYETHIKEIVNHYLKKKRQNSWLTTQNELARLKKSHLKKESSPTIGNKTREKMYGNQT